MDKVKQYYRNGILRPVKITPALPQKKTIKELFQKAEETVKEGATAVILCIDMDEPLRKDKHNEFEKFKELYKLYKALQGRTPAQPLTPKQKKQYEWMKKVLVVVNNPCLEFWYLLHFCKTTKYYPAFEPELKQDLRKHPGMDDYNKSSVYYNDSPDIFHRLGSEEGLAKARDNAFPFDINKCREQGCSEMNLIFDFFDSHL